MKAEEIKIFDGFTRFFLQLLLTMVNRSKVTVDRQLAIHDRVLRSYIRLIEIISVFHITYSRELENQISFWTYQETNSSSTTSRACRSPFIDSNISLDA